MTRSTAALAAALLSLLPLHATSQTNLPTVEEIAKRYVAARGDMDKIQSVRSLILRGPPRADGRPGRFLARARPNFLLVGEPLPTRTYAEGNDGSPWEYYADPGLVLRVTNEPAGAVRHNSYFDDPLVYAGQPGWKFALMGTEKIGDRDTYWIRATYPDGHPRDVFVDHQTWLVIANRWTAPIHAFGEQVRTETRISGYREINGALFATRFQEFEIATGKMVDDGGPGWTTIEANVELPVTYFSPPSAPATPLSRMLNAVFRARAFPSDALGWYLDFRRNPATASIDTRAGMEAIGFQCLKNGAVETGVLLLEENLKAYPNHASSHFGMGRAYRAAGKEDAAIRHFKRALEIDPNYQRAAAALKQPKG